MGHLPYPLKNDHAKSHDVHNSLNLRYDIIKRRLEALGYHVAAGLYNTVDFGLPQQRNRAWILCHLQSDVKVPAHVVTSDVNQFRRLYVTMRYCVDFTIDGQPPKKSGTLQDGKGDPKWLAGYAEQCEIYGKAGATETKVIN